MGKTWLQNRPELRYINSFLGLACAVDLMTWKIFPDAKEITESYAAWHAIFNKLGFDPTNTNHTLVSVGDGSTPRTAALFAMRSKWDCISIDPALKAGKIDEWHSRINRLKCYPNKIQDLTFDVDRAIIVAIHAHVKIPDILRSVKARERTLVCMPCCVKQTHEKLPDLEYEDISVWSGKRTIKIWKNI